jgi:hypothetical protein
VRITYKKCKYPGETGIILKMSRAALYGGQASIIMDRDNKVITIPVQTETSKIGIKKFGFVKIPALTIRPLPTRLSAASKKRIHEVKRLSCDCAPYCYVDDSMILRCAVRRGVAVQVEQIPCR